MWIVHLVILHFWTTLYFAPLMQLQELVLLWCEDVTDAGLEKIALHCPSLKTLLLRQRFMRSETLQAFADNCPNLEDVGLSSVSCIAGDLMESVAPRLKRLKILDVSWNAGRAPLQRYFDFFLMLFSTSHASRVRKND